MKEENILIFHKNPQAIESLRELCFHFGNVFASHSLEKTLSLLEVTDFSIVIVDISFASYSSLKGLFKKATSILIAGDDERKIREIIKDWPPNLYVSSLSLVQGNAKKDELERAIESARIHSQVKRELESLRKRREFDEARAQDLLVEIQEIKNTINTNLMKELEKRIELEAKYFWFQKEKQKVEKILRKIYTANDVNSLLDIIGDIKELVQAGSSTIYILDENETLGKFLKPLVWEDSFLSYSDFSLHIAVLDSQDFAAATARTGEIINISNITSDRRLSKRYQNLLKFPLQSILCIPIIHDKEVIGVIEVYNKLTNGKPDREGFTKEDQQVLRGLSEHISLAMTKLNLIQFDALTGLLRPDPFFEKVIQKISSQSKRRQEEGHFALVMGDVDWFKHYNDRNGHEAGNRLLRELASVLKSSIREEDLLCRYGGEEFLFFLVGVKSLEEACLLTERIRKNVEDHYFEFQEFQPRSNLTMSFGVTLFTREKVFTETLVTKNDLKKLANEADMALAEAKGKRPASPKIGEKEEKILPKNRVCAYYKKAEGEETQDATIKPFKDSFFLEKRKFERYYASVVLIFKEKEAPTVTKTINLSLGGARFPTDRKLPLAKTIDLILILDSKAFEVKADVIYSEKSESGSPPFYTGIKFGNLSFEESQYLENYLNSLKKKELSVH